VPFAVPDAHVFAERLRVVLHVIYLVFNEGYTASSGDQVVRVELTADAIRLARMLRTGLPNDGKIAGLLALMLLIDARRATRISGDGAAVALADQDRSLWNREQINRGTELVTWAMASTQIGPYQIQAAIAALHAEAPSFDDTDWHQIVELYRLLERLTPTPMVELNRAVAEAMVLGPHRGLDEVERIAREHDLDSHHRIASVRAHLLEMAGDRKGAIAEYRRAARLTRSQPERLSLQKRAARIVDGDGIGAG